MKRLLLINPRTHAQTYTPIVVQGGLSWVFAVLQYIEIL